MEQEKSIGVSFMKNWYYSVAIKLSILINFIRKEEKILTGIYRAEGRKISFHSHKTSEQPKHEYILQDWLID